MSRSAVTFIGPLTKMPGEEGAGKTLHRSWGFLVVQGKNDPLKLIYDNRDEAQTSRRQLAAMPYSHSVPTTKLMVAISNAMKAVFKESSSELSKGE